MANEFVVKKGLQVKGDTTLEGDLTVNGTTTTVNTATLDVEDANITVNKNGDQAGANSSVSGITVEMSDATDAKLGYDSSTTSKFKCGESGSESEVATISAAQVITNKDFDGGTASDTSRITIPKNTTANLDGLTRKEATIVWDSTLKKMKVDDGTSLTEVGTGAGGGVNYITNGTNPVGVTGWTESADGSFDIARNTTTPLRDDADFSFAKAASDESDEYIAFDFDLDPADVPALMMVTADIDASDANYADDDLKFALYDLDESEYVAFDGEIKAGKGAYKAFVQTHATSTNYELRVVVNSANTSAYTVYMTNISFSPAVRNYGSPDVYLGELTTTGSWTANTTYTGYYERKGRLLKGMVTVATSGTPTSAGLSIDLPYTMDTTGYNDYTTVGKLTVYDSSGARYPGLVSYDGNANALVCYVLNELDETDDITRNIFINETVPMPFANGDYITLNYEIPISGWSSSVRMSDVDSGKEITFGAYKDTSAQTVTAGAPAEVIFNVERSDKSNSFSTSTGRFTAPQTDEYHITANINFSTGATAPTSAQAYFLINGTGDKLGLTYMTDMDGLKWYTHALSVVVTLNKGDYISAWVESVGQDVTLAYTSGTSDRLSIYGHNMPSASAIGATEVVAFHYYRNSTHALTAGSDTTFVFNAAREQTHSDMLNTSTGIFTAPYSGWYVFEYKIEFLTGATAPSQVDAWISTSKDSIERGFSRVNDMAASKIYVLHGSARMQLSKGDTVFIEVGPVGQNITGQGEASIDRCYLTGQRLGGI
jgi:hypothetical protein